MRLCHNVLSLHRRLNCFEVCWSWHKDFGLFANLKEGVRHINSITERCKNFENIMRPFLVKTRGVNSAYLQNWWIRTSKNEECTIKFLQAIFEVNWTPFHEKKKLSGQELV